MSEPSTSTVWTPDRSTIDRANVEHFRHWLADKHGHHFAGYTELHRWSVDQQEEFWGLLWTYFDILADRPERVLDVDASPGRRWFPGASLNYVDQVLRHADRATPAIIDETEPGVEGTSTLSWRELRRQVTAVAATLRRLGVNKGDRVVGYLPNIPQAVVAFLATASLGAIWSSCGQDYAAAPAASARLGQLEPVVLITADGYRYGNKNHDRRDAIAALIHQMPSVRSTIVVPRLDLDLTALPSATITWAEASGGDHDSDIVPVGSDHPLSVLFSSGTTGRPKGIVHGHAGVLLEHLKQMAFHLDLTDQDTYFWYTSPSWMMWNFQIAGLLVGATIVCYDGSPSHPDPDALWNLAAQHRVSVLGTSPAYLQATEKAGIHPAAARDLSALRILGATGSVLPTSSYEWAVHELGRQVAVVSTTGGTDVVSCFGGAVPTMPIRAGEISVPCLGTALEAWDPHGRSVRDQVGELVITKPLPSMPLSFWNDPDNLRYQDAYYSVFPGIWRHGDWITITSLGSIIVHGRSDSTLNRNGVRMGSSDIHQVVEQLPEVHEAMVIGAEEPDGGYWMPLFVVLTQGAVLDDALRTRISSSIRKDASPRHVPDDIIAVPGIPHTRTGKKLEVPVKRLLQGADINGVVDTQSVDDPDLLKVFHHMFEGRSRRRAQLPSTANALDS